MQLYTFVWNSDCAAIIVNQSILDIKCNDIPYKDVCNVGDNKHIVGNDYLFCNNHWFKLNVSYSALLQLQYSMLFITKKTLFPPLKLNKKGQSRNS